MVSVIIAAYNEEAVIGCCLDSLRAQHTEVPVQVIVSANGCTDQTAQVAARHGAVVVDRSEPGKAAALNAAEQIATDFPRIYLDADITLPEHAIASVTQALAASPTISAVVPRRRVNTAARPLAVRAYFAINERLPVFRDGLFGRGMITVSEAGRARFNEFPAMIADDLFLDSLFATTEKAEISDFVITVDAPYSSKDLLARLIRVRRGNSEMRAAAASGEISAVVRSSDRWAWLRDVVLAEPRLAFAAMPYLTITLLAGLLARRKPRTAWGRDESTRANGVASGDRG